ncbi:hypothetical protein [Candidatus Blastococcus massiliensis]|uniref:hypothetical protein n=1 Tax=Candidatus Blastococcus massiliensis TaxID=1470358 RepID=UPI0004AECBE5|nr:hypothetical protein [Candidatus Blastococcus massiliensis]
MAEPLTAGGPVHRRDLLVGAVLLAFAVLLVPAVAARPVAAVVLAGGALAVLLAGLWPAGAVIAYLALAPLVAGSDRGAVVPGLRLNEVLLVPLLIGVAAGLVVRWLRAGRAVPYPRQPLDLAVVAVGVAGSVSPLLAMFARGQEITTDDLLYAVSWWKLLAVYTAARLVLSTPRLARRALVAVMVSAGLIGAVGVLQALRVGPVIDLLAALLPLPEGGYTLDGGRATSTLGNPVAYGVVMIYAGIAAGALAATTPRARPRLLAVAGALTLGAVASGQASVLVGVVVAGVVFALVTGMVRDLALAGSGLGLVALALLRPVLDARLQDTDPSTGLPESWTGRYGRWENLKQYFLPDIAADFQWVLGVRTAARVPGRERWREWVYIESGYAWVVWTGGIVLLAAVIALLVVMVRTGRRLTAETEPAAVAVGVLLTTVAGTLAVLMLFDPHLTFRGAGDVLFVLLGLGGGVVAWTHREPAPRPTTGEPARSGSGPAG